MDPTRTKLATLLAIALAVIALGCGGYQHRATKRPETPTASGGLHAGRGSADADVGQKQATEVYAVQQIHRGASPSEAGASEPAKERDFTLSLQSVPGVAEEADTPADLRIADRSGATAAPPPPPPPPGPPQLAQNAAGQPKGGEGQKDGAKDTAKASSQAPHDAQMIIYTGHLTIAVYQVESALNAVEKVARDHGGYLQKRADKEITVRVPREKFESALLAIEKTGDVLHRNIHAQDVTDEFTDLEIRIRNARAMRDRFAKLLEKASVKEAIEIEKELGRVTQEIELLEGKIKLLKDRIAYATITVTYNGRGSSIVPTSLRLPFPWLQGLGLPQLLRLHEER